jgi:hypothetical protein
MTVLIGGKEMGLRLEKRMKKHFNVFLYGISVLVLIIMAAILTGFLMLPVYGALYFINGQNYSAFIGAVVLILSVYILGWVFLRYRVRKK